MDSDDYDYEYNTDDDEEYDIHGHLESETDSDDEDHDLSQQKAYTILNEEVIQKRQEEAITEVSTLLSVSRDSAYLLLGRYNWNVIEANEAWFDDEDKVCKALGILKKTEIISLKAKKLECPICFDTYTRKKIKTVGCGHPFCIGCWKTYISISINDGPGCLSLRCPHPSCGVAVGESKINILVSSEDKKKYDRYLLRSFIEGNKTTKWCPAPGCEFAVGFDLGSGYYDVSCKCSYNFCWNCTEEAHRPVGCETVSKWILKNSAESENSNWILENSKPCPKCRRPIQKNHGCMHMTCTAPCRFEFCWLCLGKWTEHGEKTGGFYACNRYEAAKQQGAFDEATCRKEMAKNSLERYIHYYERWTANESSKKKALADMNKMRDIHLAKLSVKFGQPETKLTYIIEAWQQIVECRRVLKWTYAYGYFIPEKELAIRQFFEYLQGEAEAGLERLHQCAETELQTFLEKNASKDAFNDLQPKLADLTRVTRNYFDNLVKALENGLSDVDAMYIINKSTRKRPVSVGESSKGEKVGKEKWSCNHCTFINLENADSCEMCLKSRS